MSIILRFIVAVLLTGLVLNGCSTPTQKASPKATTQTSAHTEYLSKGQHTGQYWPTKEWRKCEPEAAGMNSEKLLEAMEYAATPGFNTDGLVIIRKDHIVGEAYFGNFKRDSKHTSYSMAKSFTNALIGIAIDKGIIKGIDEKICQYYDEWDCDDADDLRSRITIRHAMTLTTGLEWQENWAKIDPKTNDAIKMWQSKKFVAYMMVRDGLYEPGDRFYFSSGDPILLSGVIQQATGMKALDFANRNLFPHLGISNVRWESDTNGYTVTNSGLHMTARDYAKFGHLFLNKGYWDGKQIVSEEWVTASTKTDPSVRMWQAYGYLWHVNLPYRLKPKWSKSSMSSDSLPPDGYMAEGIFGQNIFIIPSKDLVIVRVANQRKDRMDLVKFLTMVLSAIES